MSDFVVFLSLLDEKVLLFLNGFHTPFWDDVMWTVTGKWVWIPFYVFLAVCVFRHASWKRGLLCLLLIGATITLADQFCGSLLRQAVERMRPSNPDNPVSAFVHIVNDYHGGRYGFPSCHAANSFALATFLSLFFRNRKATVLLMLWAALVSYSRIYLGVHYPGDILAGMFFGSFFALLLFRVYCYLLAYHENIKLSPERYYSVLIKRLIAVRVFFTVFVMLLRK